jgi:ketosteroid isomerase-like protein
MKQLVLALAFLSTSLAAEAPPVTDDLAQRVQQLEDRAALKHLVDTFSNLADRKDIEKQVQLFTEDAVVESYSDGQMTSSLKGREQIANGFGRFLSNFDTVYHINGQQTVELQGDRATGTSYCLVVLIGEQGGRRLRTTMGVTYSDDYVRRGSQWLIARRDSNFAWRKIEDAAAAAE